MDSSSEVTSPDFDRFEFVLLKWASDASNFSEAELDQLQERHLAFLDEQTANGHIRLAGPFNEQRDPSIRGLCFYQTGSLEHTRNLASSDPAVIAGRLEVDVMYFYCPKGML